METIGMLDPNIAMLCKAINSSTIKNNGCFQTFDETLYPNNNLSAKAIIMIAEKGSEGIISMTSEFKNFWVLENGIKNTSNRKKELMLNCAIKYAEENIKRMSVIGNSKSDANAFSASTSMNNNVSAPAISFNCKDAFG